VKKTVSFIILTGVLMCAAIPCQAMVLHLSFDKIVKQADVIFVGTVVDQQCRFGPNGNRYWQNIDRHAWINQWNWNCDQKGGRR
jgi:hypothetical protein